MACQPAAAKRARWSVLVGERGRAVYGDLVVVPEHDEPRQLQVAGEVDRLVGDALHQAAVAGDHVGPMIDEIAVPGRQRALGDGHADSGGEALPKGPGRRLDAESVAVLGMAGGPGAELSEALDFLDGHVGVAGQIEQRVKQHRPVAGRQDETVAVWPTRGRGIEFEELREQHRRDVGHAHRHAGMAGLGFFDRVDRQEADGVGHRRMGSRCGLPRHDVHFLRTSLRVFRREWRGAGVRPASGSSGSG